MSLSTRLDKLEAAMRGRDGDPPDRRWICRRLIYDPCEWEIEEEEAISRMKTEELNRLVAAGKIRAIDREQVRFIVRRIVQPLLDPTTRAIRRMGDIWWLVGFTDPPAVVCQAKSETRFILSTIRNR